jgi:cbb3-type cytochrome oxidase subunit 3
MLSGRKSRSQTLAKATLTVASFVLVVFASYAFAHVAQAQVTANEVLPTELGNVIGTGTGDIRITIARIVRGFLGFLGTIALLLVLYAGFTWMTAAGDAEKIDRAKKILTSAVIGLVIIMSAFAITSFILRQLLNEAGGLGGGAGGGGSSAPDDRACIGLSATCPAGALGNGIIESHYPNRNATGVARNTRVVVSFKQRIDPASIVVGGANATVAISKSADVTSSNQFAQKYAQSLTSADIDVAVSADGKSVTFIQRNCPTNCFGSPSENVFYTIGLRGGTDGIRREGGAPAFTGTFNSGYLWEFQVSTVLDLTPPKVAYVVPNDGASGVPRNSLVQVMFDEPVDPVSVTSGLSVTRTGGNVVAGVQQIGNAYRAVEFRTNESCGTNSCGEEVFCLPGNQQINVRVRADALTTSPPLGIYPPNGITDMAGNSLDGNGNGTAQGSPADDYASDFRTSNEIDLVPPKVVAQEPAVLQGNIARDLAMAVTFSKLMSSASFTTDNARLVPGPNGAPTNYSIATEAISSVAGGDADQTKGIIDHDLLSINQPYAINLTSGLRDLRQNCFYPGGGQTVCTGTEAYCCNGVPSQVACGFLP